MESINQFFKNIGTFIGRMTPSQVMMLLGVGAGTIAGTVILIGWINTVSYTRLYSDLSASEAGDVATYLDTQKIPYQLSNGGTVIEVPSSDVYKTRIALAAEGLPRNGNMGYSIFDENNLGMTDFLQKLNFRRALEGEITRTIMEMDEVKSARVHIVMPKQRLFKDDQKKTTASVLLKLKGNNGLNRTQISGITHLVAASVEGLSPDNISIVDYNGNLLTSGDRDDPLAGLSSSQLDVRKQVEEYLQTKSQSMLDDVLGVGKSVVRITADLNFQQIEKTAESFDANNPSIRSEERVVNSASLADKTEETAESNEENSSETVITNYELNKTVEHIVNAIGNIDRLSVAVMVDGIYAPVEAEDGSTEYVYQPRPQEELDRMAAIVKNSVGFDSQRNDQIEMVNIAFDRQNMQDEQEMLDSMYMWDFYLEIARKLGIVLMLAFIFLIARKKSKKLFAALGKLVPAPRVIRQEVEQPVIEEEQDELQPVPEEKRKQTIVDRMQKTAQGQPEEIAKVIKTMMIE
ncbi:MAG: flagellar basal-body MS-ring/collar protein FliF [bacterium]|nr:flagellar basal-body MS-ring/collar protein FliF [bacterium]